MAKDSGLREGDWFAVPLASGGFGVGFAARLDGRGLVLGYFSPLRYDESPSLPEAAFPPDATLRVALFGDLGFIEGRWTILGRTEGWSRDDWPLTDFARHEELTGRCYRTSYGGDLRNRPSEILSSPGDLVGLPEYGVGGSGFVEAKLARLLAN
jgi:hypothetical protein